ncbi:MAG TPA: isochorismatase family cysteine hydrolase [Anaerolineae bacterium]
MDTSTSTSTPFLAWLAEWHAGLPQPSLESILADPGRTALLSVDVINGFCHAGPLASPRVKGIIDPIVRLMRAAHAAGVKHFVVAQDTHDPEAVEFGDYPPHCVRGSEESETVPELKALPFWSEVVVLPKNSIHSAIGTGLEAWLDAHPNVSTFIVVGDCTDLCTHQLAMHLRLRANALQKRGVRVIVPEDCVDTYDTPIDVAQSIGALPHDADLLHRIFLYHMALNGIEVVKRIAVPEAEPVERATV